jgi:hypothetical protein
VAPRVAGLVARDGAGQVEDTPVGDVADHAALAEYELACGEDDSVFGGRGLVSGGEVDEAGCWSG